MEGQEVNSGASLTPLVSVSITAFNAEKWLSKALDSVLMQRTTFPIEIVVGDDCSVDGTLRIARSYREKHPDVIRVLERSKNVGIQRNTYDNLEQCRGKYIAWLDGDDCWTDPDKLAIQVETMESDPSISVCFHYVRYVGSAGEVIRAKNPTDAPGRFGIEDLIRHHLIETPSAMFRNGLQRGLPEWYFDVAPISDFPLWLVAARSGNLVLLDRVMADYLVRDGSVFSGEGTLFKLEKNTAVYERIESIIPPELHRLARAGKGMRYELMAYSLRKQGQFVASRKAAIKAFTSPCFRDRFGSKSKALLASLVREAEWRLKRVVPGFRKERS